MSWAGIKQDIKERFFNFETAKGFYLVPVGLFGLWVAVLHVEYVIQAMGAAYFGYMVFEGVRKILVNRIKQGLKRGQLAAKRATLEQEKKNGVSG